MPFALLPGNHDYDGNAPRRSTSRLSEFFPVEAFRSWPSFGGVFQKDKLDKIVDQIKPWIEARKPVCGRQDEKINRELFGADMRIGSSALIPLYHTAGLGLLCLGSTSHDRFGLTMGTIFLQQLGELVSNRLKNLLQVT